MDSLIIIVVVLVVALVLFSGKNKTGKNKGTHDKQLNNVKDADFTCQPVMNASESQLYQGETG